jgi:UDP-N-acetylmuramate dehydrogenase
MALAYQKPNDEIAEDFLKIIKKSEYIKRQEPLAGHTTFRIGGPADFFLTPETEEEVTAVVTYCKQQKIPYFFLGNGSNLLVSDHGYRGVIISLMKHFKEILAEGETMTAGAGALLSSLASKAAQQELTGLEFAAGIPGTIGGAVMMNAGAYGGEICQVFKSARILSEDGTIREYSKEELAFGYRCSSLKENHGIVLRAEFSLQKGNPDEIRAKMAEYNAKRREKQPLEYPSAGSTFKRPEGYFAGKLIEEAGLKGYHIGDMEVSRKHSGFVINKGNGTAEEARELILDIQDIVLEKFGVKLEPEIRFLGFTEEKFIGG